MLNLQNGTMMCIGAVTEAAVCSIAIVSNILQLDANMKKLAERQLQPDPTCRMWFDIACSQQGITAKTNVYLRMWSMST